MDALPVEEKTGPALREQGHDKDDAGATCPVMHACGHDMHMTSLVGRGDAARPGEVALARHARPDRPAAAEEGGRAPVAMIKDGLLTRFPKPDFAIALHDSSCLPGGRHRLHARLRARQRRFRGHHDLRPRRPRLRAADHGRPDRHRRPHDRRAADDRLPRERPAAIRRSSPSARSTAARSTTSFRTR